MNGEYINGDCVEGLKQYKDNYFDLAIVDPPYGIKKHGHSGDKKHGWKKYEYKKWDATIPTEDYFNELFRVSRNQIIWGANYFVKHIPPCKAWIVWNKGQKLSMSDGELAFTSFEKVLRIFTLNRCKIKCYGGSIHPTQKPVALYRWLLKKYAKRGDLILDTHVGSASSLIACEIEGFQYIGYEKDKDYYRDSMKRIKNHLSQKTLF